MRDEDTEALTGFLMDADCLDRLAPWMGGVNVFEVLKIVDAEIRHSNMLAWLLNPNEGHGLGGAVLSGLVSLLIKSGAFPREDALRLLLADWDSFSVFREWKSSIDLLIVSDAEQVAIVIENKIWSGEEPTQLRRYESIARQEFENYQTVFLYLTPNGYESSNPKIWRALNYTDMAAIIERAIEITDISDEVEMIVSQYLRIVRRNIVGDEKLKQVCSDIYRKHKVALDLIYEHRPDEVQQLAGIMLEWCQAKQDEGIIEYFPQQSTKTSILFTTAKLKERFPAIEGGSDGKKTPYYVFYEIRLMTTDRYFKTRPVLSNAPGIPDGRKRALLDYAHAYDPNWNPKEWQWHEIQGITKKHPFIGEWPEDHEEETWEILDNDLNLLLEAEYEWEKSE